jgi:Bacterial Ig-like domain (group 2)
MRARRGDLHDIAICLMFAVGVAACSASFPTEPSATVPPLSGLVVRYPVRGTRMVIESAELFNRQFEAYTVDADGVYTRVTDHAAWLSTDTLVVRPSVISPGIIGLFQAGSAEIHASYQGFLTSLPVVVRDRPAPPYLEITVGISPVRVEVVSGQSGTNRQTITSGVTWTSSDGRIASVDGRGSVSGLLPGNVEIRATYNGLSDRYWMSVPPRDR